VDAEEVMSGVAAMAMPLGLGVGAIEGEPRGRLWQPTLRSPV
jgi:hypothetical protein